MEDTEEGIGVQRVDRDASQSTEKPVVTGLTVDPDVAKRRDQVLANPLGEIQRVMDKRSTQEFHHPEHLLEPTERARRKLPRELKALGGLFQVEQFTDTGFAEECRAGKNLPHVLVNSEAMGEHGSHILVWNPEEDGRNISITVQEIMVGSYSGGEAHAMPVSSPSSHLKANRSRIGIEVKTMDGPLAKRGGLGFARFIGDAVETKARRLGYSSSRR
jgi:hypothetical protein